MAKIKTTMTVSLEEFGKKAGEYALDEYEYNGLTIRQWADKITSGEYQPVRHGRWVIDPGCGEYGKCSECEGKSGTQCDGVEPIPLLTAYCPHCGTKMDGGDK